MTVENQPPSNRSLNRRTFLAGAAGAAALSTSPVLAFDILKGGAAQGLMNSAGAIAQGFMLGEKDEISMGNQYYAEYLAKSGGAYDNRNAQEALRAFSAPLIATSQRQNLPWEITLVNNAEVNAWALPGGKLAVNAGLVAQAKDPNELASVVAHEIGHSELSHGIQQMRTAAFMSGLSQAGQMAIASVMGSAAPLTNQVLQAVKGPLFNLVNAGYSRKREFEADAHILDVFKVTGFQPAKADDFFHTLMKLYPPNQSTTTSLFSTHPGTQDRINAIEAKASGMSAGSITSDKNFAALKEIFPTPAG